LWNGRHGSHQYFNALTTKDTKEHKGQENLTTDEHGLRGSEKIAKIAEIAKVLPKLKNQNL
jgi:hypothetical protein